ncbi:MAG: hypothetical protein GKR89_35680 [Candidatus Latescibacteria bacterium]|nr:hypothetical protein [Candidatus Latescibacterota bacterium]
MKHHVLEAHFDDETAHRLDGLRQSLYEQGLMGRAPYGQPHISLASFAAGDLPGWQGRLDELAERPAIAVTLSYLGLFPGRNAVLYLGVTPTAELGDLHAAAHRVVAANAVDLLELYGPDRIVFHATLGSVGDRGLGRAVESLNTLELPLSGRLQRLALVEYSPARLLVESSLEGSRL